MPPAYKKYGIFWTCLLLVVIDVTLVRIDLTHSRHMLTFAMLDIGQGDALFIESPTGTQVLVDAGPPRKVLGALRRVTSPFDGTIDALIITNPDADHIGGFADILKEYDVGLALEPGTRNDSKTFQKLKETLHEKNIPDLLARKGMQLDLGGGAMIDILFPDRDVSTWSTNDGSIVARLTYGNTSVMLMGDATSKTESLVLQSGAHVESDILKAGHHGSRTSSSPAFVRAVAPAYALISDGADNTYGHPHQEVLTTLSEFGVKIFRTDLMGTIIMKSDGKTESFSFIK